MVWIKNIKLVKPVYHICLIRWSCELKRLDWGIGTGERVLKAKFKYILAGNMAYQVTRNCNILATILVLASRTRRAADTGVARMLLVLNRSTPVSTMKHNWWNNVCCWIKLSDERISTRRCSLLQGNEESSMPTLDVVFIQSWHFSMTSPHHEMPCSQIVWLFGKRINNSWKTCSLCD